MSEDYKKQAQEKLSAARQLLKEAGELAELGRFDLSFMKHSYYAKSLHEGFSGLSLEDQVKRVGLLPADGTLEGLSSDQIQRMEYKLDDMVYMDEYAEAGEWWAPSTC